MSDDTQPPLPRILPDPGLPPNPSKELIQGLLAAAVKAGIPLPVPDSGAPEAPTIRTEWGWRRMALELGAVLRNRDIFLRAGELGTIDKVTGEWKRFDQRSFAGWVEEFAGFTHKGEKTILNGESASMIMSQFVFRDQIRPVETIHTIRLPVLRKDGRPEFLPVGYDEETRIYTVETLKYDMEWPIDRARDFLREHHQGFPWMRGELEELDAAEGRPVVLERNRSYSVHIAAMIGTYCRGMFAPGTLRPMIPYTANQQGSGKSVLVQMVLAPVFGLQAANKMPRNDDELNKELDAAAQAFAPFVFFDDIGHSMHSPPLNAFLTAPRRAGRILGGKDRFDVPVVTQVFCTGNNVKGSRDLARRALMVELFYAGELKDRTFPIEISPAWLNRPEVRKGFLSALCAIVKHWTNRSQAEQELLSKNIKGLPSFAEWTELVAGIVMYAGYANPLSPALSPMDEDDDQMRDLLAAAAVEEEKARVFNRQDLATIAREKELLEDLVGGKDDKEMDSKQNKRFGLRLKAYLGREFVDGKGRRFRFGKKRQKHGATYPLEFL